MQDKMRVDKWLWCVRIFKSRTIAIDACKAGKIKAGGITLKPAHLIQPGDLIEVRKNGFSFQFKVLELLKSRVSAPIAQSCYANFTTEEELNKYNDWFVGKATPEKREKGAGRPTKRERRQIDGFKSDGDSALDWDDAE
ncbi:MAG: RNA-binding S4 domain-containing protein [Haliscomenobacter sp.]|nr:RNA-binding S4 domain-containing protein [Haliscomenobacter sp.]MBK7474747.1 RNA-binding S4 domain-containing protein [Haliscomenobacter sp.]MBK8877605.1 RNA-binding S4 domain-containing protein [Haliscomenobacter sp.]